MTSRTTDFHCPRCRKYLFSEYTYPMGKDERQKLAEHIAAYCPCPPAHIEGSRHNSRGVNTRKANDALTDEQIIALRQLLQWVAGTGDRPNARERAALQALRKTLEAK